MRWRSGRGQPQLRAAASSTRWPPISPAPRWMAASRRMRCWQSCGMRMAVVPRRPSRRACAGGKRSTGRRASSLAGRSWRPRARRRWRRRWPTCRRWRRAAGASRPRWRSCRRARLPLSQPRSAGAAITSSDREGRPPMSESDTSAATGRDPGLAEAVRFQRDLYLVWQFAAAESGGLPLTGRGYLTRATLRGLRALLAAAEGLSVPATGADVSETEDVRLHFIRRLSQRLGLLRLAPSAGADERSRTTARASEGGRLIAAEREEMARYLDHPLAERLRICARLWVAGGWWPDQPDGRGPPPRVMTPAPPRLAVARRRLLDALAAAVPDTAYPLPPLRAETPAQRRSRAQGRAGAQRPLAAVRVAAQGGDAAIQAAALLGPLAWLGFVTLGQDQAGGGGPHTYQTCAPARALRSDEPAPDLREEHGRIVALPNLALVAYAPLTAPTLLALDTCAERQSLETTARYTLTRAAFARAGWDA